MIVITSTATRVTTAEQMQDGIITNAKLANATVEPEKLSTKTRLRIFMGSV